MTKKSDDLILLMHEGKDDIGVRKFDSMLFHGNGHNGSVQLMETITKRLDYGHMHLCGLQQGVDTESREYKEGFDSIKDVCRDVLASFGISDEGLKWENLPYPGYNCVFEEKEEEKL